jgi:hypothetical protein
MTNINWSAIPDAREDQKRSADLLIRLENGEERRTGYDGGWVYFTDATHTVDNKQTIAADTPTVLSIDKAGAESVTDFRRGVPLDIFANNTLQPQATGETFEINLTFRLAKSTSQSIYAEVDVGIGSDYSTIAFQDRRALTKGSGVTDFVFFNGTLFVTPAFGAHGCRFFIRCSQEVTVWDKGIFIQRTHSP